MSKRYHKLIPLVFAAALLTACFSFSVSAEQPQIKTPLNRTSQKVLSCTLIPLFIDDEYIGSGIVVNSVPFVPLLAFTECMLQDDCDSAWEQETGTATITSDVLSMRLRTDQRYMTANDRYYYLGDRVYNINGTIMVPLRVMAHIFSLELEPDTEAWNIRIDTGNICIPAPGDTFYDEEDLYWLSRVISSEAGNQSMEGMIGVGNVVLNRVRDERGAYGNSVMEVIFQPGQFDVVRTGAIYNDPREIAVIAAKLCLEGYNTVGGSCWFVNPEIGKTTWFDLYRTYEVTIGDHIFYS